MDGWWLNEWMIKGRMDEQVNGWMDGRMSRRVDG